ncbi:hypothetical protein GCM10011575_31380 [Microlunatus endophyticus]|uniref:DUF3566 domain-containing protein n=1 Tax=Microlunatus endophyticus TaxID=1716077 RepID=A0A917W727_9ACTN|nr:DUF3566 domain-containing protein [Microlunatus endophyticus]GGL70624.1 hypothetical protein GCM10011575_31380 [Microlunatus endophyticus]
MSERSRGPEGSSGAAPTDRGNAAGSDDFYAAAAASVAARSGSNGSNGRSGTNGGATAPAPDRDKLTPQARPAQRPNQPVPNQPVARSGGNPVPSKPSEDGSDDEPTTGISGIASSVLNAVRPKPKAEKPEDTEKLAERTSSAAPAAEAVRTPVLPSTPPVAANPAVTVTAVKDKPKAGAARGTRKARLRLSRLDPWSVMKTSFMFSIAAGIVFVVAVFAVWTVIGSSGLFSSIDSIVGSVLQSPGDTTPFRVEDYVNTQKVMGVTAFLACIDVVIFTALATLASFLYNLAATMLGGLEVTLAED